jgi:hypothetical protein
MLEVVMVLMRIISVVVDGLAVSGCGLSARVDARNDYQSSESNYKARLTANSASPRNCEGLRLAMEADERKYNNLSAGLNPGSQRENTLTILNR